MTDSRKQVFLRSEYSWGHTLLLVLGLGLDLDLGLESSSQPRSLAAVGPLFRSPF
jgi:hypothetical protein